MPLADPAGPAGLYVLEDRAVRVPGDDPDAVRRRSRPLDDLAARRLQGSQHRGEAGHLDRRRPVAVSGSVAGQRLPAIVRG